MTRVSLDRIAADYGAARVLEELSLEIEEAEFVALLGPSGCGKTTILKIIAGLLEPTRGDVRFDGESVIDLPAERRGAVMVFQKPLLFPYLTVAENVAFGLKMRGMPREERERRVREALALVQLEGYESRRPQQLSGGQEQRVTLARALVTEPRVLLLDEPFSALDENLRGEMRRLVRSLQRRLKITTLFVTHDQAEAAEMADRVALLLDGRLEQYGAARDFYTAPRSSKAARFFGWRLIEGARRGGRFQTAIGDFAIDESYKGGDGDRGWLALRPESLQIVGNENAEGENGRGENGRGENDRGNQFEAVVKSSLDLGTRIRYSLALANGDELEIEQATGTIHPPGARLKLRLPDYVLLDK